MTEYNPRAIDFIRREPSEMLERAASFQSAMSTRRSVRHFTNEPVDKRVIRHAIATANSAPSGANMQPWHFVAVQNQTIKRRIRVAAEAEERELYTHRASDEWLSALAPLGTDADKPFLETAPWLITVFARKHTIADDGRKLKHYYTPESVGIATGLLIASLHYAGLGTLTHTPSPMGFLRDILERPKHEKPYLLVVAGYPEIPLQVPTIDKLDLDDVLSVI